MKTKMVNSNQHRHGQQKIKEDRKKHKNLRTGRPPLPTTTATVDDGGTFVSLGCPGFCLVTNIVSCCVNTGGWWKMHGVERREKITKMTKYDKGLEIGDVGGREGLDYSLAYGKAKRG